MRDDLEVRLVTALETFVMTLETIAENTTPADAGTTEPPAETTGEAKTTTKGGTK